MHKTERLKFHLLELLQHFFAWTHLGVYGITASPTTCTKYKLLFLCIYSYKIQFYEDNLFTNFLIHNIVLKTRLFFLYVHNIMISPGRADWNSLCTSKKLPFEDLGVIQRNQTKICLKPANRRGYSQKR